MKKTLLFVVTFAVLVISAVAYLLTRPEEPLVQPQVATIEGQTDDQEQVLPVNDSEQSAAEDQALEQTGIYKDYSVEALASVTGKKYLFFHAPWCPQCRNIENGIKAQGVPAGFTILKVDYDSNQSLRQKYGVTLQTTFVSLDDNNDGTGKYVAYDEPTFDAVKREFLQ